MLETVRYLDEHAPAVDPTKFRLVYEFVQWAAGRAMEWYDDGRRGLAHSLFLHLLDQHPELQHLRLDPLFVGDMLAASKQGRTAFESHMRSVRP